MPPAGAAVKSLLFRACAALLTFGACTRVSTPQTFTASRVSGLRGVVRAPGDKSMSHRALIFGGMAEGVTEIEGLLEGDDILATGRAMQALGASVERIGEGRWRVEGRGPLRSGALEIAAAIRLRKEINGEIWLILSGLLSVVLGVVVTWMLLTRPVESFLALGWLIGFYAAVFGVMMILLGLRLRKADRSDGAAFDDAPPSAKA